MTEANEFLGSELEIRHKNMTGLNWIPISLYQKKLEKNYLKTTTYYKSKNNDNYTEHNSRVKDEFEDTKG